MENLEPSGSPNVASRKAHIQEKLKGLLDYLADADGPYIVLENLPVNWVKIQSFNPEEGTPSLTDGFFFKPMTGETLAQYPIDNAVVDPNLGYFEDFEPNANPQTTLEKMAIKPRGRALIVHNYLDVLYFNMPRQGVKGQSLEEIGLWSGVGYENPFWVEIGLMFHLRPRKVDWSTGGVYEHVGEDGTKNPHLYLTAYHGMYGNNDKILIGELAIIAQAIYNRLGQNDFDDTFFPVLIASFFGEQHGRILHGCFDESGMLNILASQRFDFRTGATAPFDLFIRYRMSEPVAEAAPELTPDPPSTPRRTTTSKTPPTSPWERLILEQQGLHYYNYRAPS